MERDSLKALLRASGGAIEHGELFYLGDPSLAPPSEDTAGNLWSAADDVPEAEGRGWLRVATGGTSGERRWARHDERTLTAAVRGFCAHFGFTRVNAVDVLPAYHVSGLMARVRCAETGGRHVAWSWKRLESGERPELDLAQGDWVLSLVPTQVQRLLVSPEAVAWLRDFKVIFIGGGPVWPELADSAARAGLRLSLSYGMTETAAMVAALRPEDFLAGARSCGGVLPHARITLDENGRIGIAGESVFLGYGLSERAEEIFWTEDIGRWDERGYLAILGRRDAVIITGGKKVQPQEVEAALRASGEFSDVAVIGVPDAEWGEIVVACYPAGGRAPDLVRAVAGVRGAMKPKRFLAVVDWPRAAQGKINRALLKAWALK
jgi:O-succinylbenzoic acid--CoA ligase